MTADETTPHANVDLDLCEAMATEVMDQVYDDAETDDRVDFGCVMFSLLVNAVYVLRNHGWTEAELTEAVTHHSKNYDDTTLDQATAGSTAIN